MHLSSQIQIAPQTEETQWSLVLVVVVSQSFIIQTSCGTAAANVSRLVGMNNPAASWCCFDFAAVHVANYSQLHTSASH